MHMDTLLNVIDITRQNIGGRQALSDPESTSLFIATEKWCKEYNPKKIDGDLHEEVGLRAALYVMEYEMTKPRNER